jgi:DNA-binding CsgD family transcriptional regulator
MRRRSLHAILDDPFADADLLTQAERQVAGLIAKGYSVEEVASYAGISENAVRMRLRYILAKLGVKSKTSLTTLFVARLNEIAPRR